jgi:putative inorganic carbon (hco3(-)) transporter
VIAIPKHPSWRLIVFYTVSLAFILLNVWFISKKELLYINFLPYAFAIVLLALFSLDKLLLLVVFFTPLSLPLSELAQGLSFDMFLPTEPLLFGVLLIFILKLPSGKIFKKEVLNHPVTLMIGIYLIWILITSFTSSMPVVSLKFLLSKIWFVIGFYLLGIKLFEEKKNFERFVWFYVAALVLVIGYTITRHLGYGLYDKQAAHFVMNPFYKDHTSYGAALALFIPFMIIFSFSSGTRAVYRWQARTVLIILLIAIIFSYGRAAWISIFGAMAVYFLIKLKIRFSTVAISAVSLVLLVLVFQNQVVGYLERNKEQSSANLAEHFSSMTNITSDASNLERINRWSCAIRMFRDRPVFGWGPGTYMFQYAPYQLTKDRTIISTNAGDMGNAHSEYLGPLAESGLAGMITVLLLIITVMNTAFRLYPRIKDPQMKNYFLGAVTGLITYYLHGLMNNFLDTDKISVPFWGFTAMIVALDLYTKDKKSSVTPDLNHGFSNHR